MEKTIKLSCLFQRCKLNKQLKYYFLVVYEHIWALVLMWDNQNRRIKLSMFLRTHYDILRLSHSHILKVLSPQWLTFSSPSSSVNWQECHCLQSPHLFTFSRTDIIWKSPKYTKCLNICFGPRAVHVWLWLIEIVLTDNFWSHKLSALIWFAEHQGGLLIRDVPLIFKHFEIWFYTFQMIKRVKYNQIEVRIVNIKPEQSRNHKATC